MACFAMELDCTRALPGRKMGTLHTILPSCSLNTLRSRFAQPRDATFLALSFGMLGAVIKMNEGGGRLEHSGAAVTVMILMVPNRSKSSSLSCRRSG